MIFFAASYFSMSSSILKNKKRIFLLLLIYPAVTLILSVVKPSQNIKFVLLSSFVFISLLGFFYIQSTDYSRKFRRYKLYQATVFFLVLLELTVNAGNVMKTFKNNDVSAYQDYTQEATRQIQYITEHDPGFYRFHQAHPSYTNSLNLTANFNEPLAYSYFGISSYTSSPDNRGLSFMNRMGYAKCGVNMNITTGCILSTDSLLGVKYVLSPVQMDGLKEVTWSKTLNNERIYENPYVMPLAFTLNPTTIEKVPYHNNPFTYQNLLWSELLGRSVSIYKQIEYRPKVIDDQTVAFVLQPPISGEGIMYGDVPTSKNLEGELLINKKIKQGYSKWTAPSVFYIPQNSSPTVEFRTKYKNSQVVTDAQFYYLDLKEWENICKEVQANAAQISTFKNGYVEINASGQKGQLLFTSVPYDEGWQITVNGNKVSPVRIEDYLMAIPLEDGENHVVLTYQLPEFKKGILVTLLSILILIGVSSRHTHLFNS